MVHGSFADAFAHRLRHSVDLLIFNPPYVPTTAEELEAAKAKASLAGAWAGGEDGMSVTDLFLPSVAVRGSGHALTDAAGPAQRERRLLPRRRRLEQA